MAETGTLDADHRGLDDDLLARRYFEKLRAIVGALPAVLSETIRDRMFSGPDAEVIEIYLDAILASVGALSMKYLVAGRVDGPLRKFLTIDVHESGYPVWSEMAQMAADAAVVELVLRGRRVPGLGALQQRQPGLGAAFGGQALAGVLKGHGGVGGQP